VISVPHPLFFGFTLALACVFSEAHAQPMQGSELATVSLHSEQTAIAPGSTTWIAVRFVIEPEWHLYWKNPGVSGQAPIVDWELPEGYTMGEPLWPAPHRHVSPGDILDYTYEYELTLLFPLAADPAVKAGEEVTLRADADFLICDKRICLFGGGKAEITLPVQAMAKPNSKNTKLFAQTRSRIPRPATEASALGIRTSWTGKTLTLTVPGAERISFFPHFGEDLAEALDLVEAGESAGDTLVLSYDDFRKAPPDAPKDVAAVLSVLKDGRMIHQEIRVPFVPQESGR